MGCLMEFYESLTPLYLYENEFQNPQIFHQPLRFSPERSTLKKGWFSITNIQLSHYLEKGYKCGFCYEEVHYFVKTGFRLGLQRCFSFCSVTKRRTYFFSQS
jgi:hypothetical protein